MRGTVSSVTSGSADSYLGAVEIKEESRDGSVRVGWRQEKGAQRGVALGLEARRLNAEGRAVQRRHKNRRTALNRTTARHRQVQATGVVRVGQKAGDEALARAGVELAPHSEAFGGSDDDAEEFEVALHLRDACGRGISFRHQK